MTIRFGAAVLLFLASAFCFNQSTQKSVKSAKRWAIPVGVIMVVLEIILLTDHD